MVQGQLHPGLYQKWCCQQVQKREIPEKAGKRVDQKTSGVLSSFQKDQNGLKALGREMLFMFLPKEKTVVHQLFYGQRGLVGVSVEWQSSQIVLMALIILLIRVRGKTGNVRFFNEQKTVLSQP